MIGVYGGGLTSLHRQATHDDFGDGSFSIGICTYSVE
jgi:hypothetical protein